MANSMMVFCDITLVALLSMVDIDTIRAISVAMKKATDRAKEELKSRANCCLTHSTNLKMWKFGFHWLYENVVTGEFVKRFNGPINMNDWRRVPALAVQCQYCEDLHHLERNGRWDQPGLIRTESLIRRSVLDRFNVQHPMQLMLARVADAMADGPMLPVQQ